MGGRKGGDMGCVVREVRARRKALVFTGKETEAHGGERTHPRP